MLVSIYSANSKSAGLKEHSCNKGESALADIKAPEALHTSSETKNFASSAREIGIWAVKGAKIEITKAAIIITLLIFMPLL